MPLPYQPHSETSQAAAEAAEPRAATDRQRILAWLDIMGTRGGTDEEICQALDLNPSTGRPRRIELVTSGDVIDSGRTRKTVAGREATVWVRNRGGQRMLF